MKICPDTLAKILTKFALIYKKKLINIVETITGVVMSESLETFAFLLANLPKILFQV